MTRAYTGGRSGRERRCEFPVFLRSFHSTLGQLISLLFHRIGLGFSKADFKAVMEYSIRSIVPTAYAARI